MTATEYIVKLKSDLKKQTSSVVMRLPANKFRETMAALFGVQDETKDLEVRFVLEDMSGSLTFDWQESHLPITGAPLISPAVLLNSSAFDVIKPTTRWDDLVLDASTRRVTQRILLESKDWDYLKSSGLSPANCVLFCGPMGSGKSTTAEAIAAELGLKLMRFSYRKLTSVLSAGNPAEIKEIVDFLGSSRWVVLVDDVAPEHNAYDDRGFKDFRCDFSSFLPLFNSMFSRSLVVFASTSEEALHPSLWQRFNEVVRFNSPGRQEIRGALVKWLDDLEYSNTQLERLLEIADDLSFSSVERLCLDVKRSCVLRGDKYMQDSDLNEARERQQSRTRSFNFSGVKLVNVS